MMNAKNNIYDVIIVGAGPAGLSAARDLALAGKQVLVLEKNKIAGDKVCAGGLTLKDFRELNLPRFLIEAEFSSINLHFNQHLIKLELEEPWLWTCDRKTLGRWQTEEAEKAGAEVQLATPVEEVQKDFVLIRGQRKLYYQYLIGADGSNSIVRKFLALETKKIVLAIQYVVPKAEFKELEIFFDFKKFGLCYSWIFPYKEYSSIGAGTDPRFVSGAKLRENFDIFCREINLDPSQYKLQAAPINYDYKGIEFGNVFLAGDAAGLASGSTGEGIYPAIISGQEIAQKIIDPDYDLKKIDAVLEAKKLEERMLTIYKASKIAATLLFAFGFKLLKREKIRKRAIKFLAEK